jgi:hypothetical protein
VLPFCQCFSVFVNRADRVRRSADGDDLGFQAEVSLEIRTVERTIVRVNVYPLDHGAALFEREPGRNVRAVVKPREDNLVALGKKTTKRAGDTKCEC